MEEPSTHRSGATPRPAIQLHTLRTSSDPLSTLIRRVNEAGFEGIEFAHEFLEADPHALREVLRETGVVPVAAHVDLKRLEANPEAVVDKCRAVGCPRVVIPHVGRGHFRTKERIDSVATRLNVLSDRLQVDGIELLYHNARGQFSPPIDAPGIETLSRVPLPDGIWGAITTGLSWISGPGSERRPPVARTGFGRLLGQTSERVKFEIDTGWVAAAGYDPTSVFDLVGHRLALVHLTDVVMRRRFPARFDSVSAGEGSIDVARIIEAARETPAEWLVYENDDATDSQEAIRSGIDVLRPLISESAASEMPRSESADQTRSRSARTD